MKTLKELFLDELADRYGAEKRLIRAMPKMAKAATCGNLRKLILSHLKETVGHVKKLETVFMAFDARIRAKKCEATIGLLKEGYEVIANFKGSMAINAALISVAQKIEHYEIASYGCLREWAALLGNNDMSRLLRGILIEERAANQALIDLARSSSNNEALGACGATSMIGRRGIRPMSGDRLRPVLM